jgi:hypothetical protein
MSFVEQIVKKTPDKYNSIIESRVLGKTLQLKLNQYNALQSQYDTLLQYENNNRNQAAARDAVCKSRNPGTAIVKDVKTKCRAGGCNYALGSTGWIDFCNASNAESTCCGTNNTTVTFYATSFQDWTDIPNTSYQYGMVPNSTASTDDWKFLGKQNNVDDCKLKAVDDKNQEYASVVYYPEDFPNEWKKSCFGGVKGGKINAQYQSKTITSLAPNGTSRLGGQEGEKLLKEIKNKGNEIEKIVKEQQQNNLGSMRSNNLLVNMREKPGNELENMLEKLRRDRVEINRIIKQPVESAAAEDGYQRQLSNYIIYFLWIILVLISIGLSVHLLTSQSVSVITYIFTAIWVVILAKYYYKQITIYGVKYWDYISSVIVDSIN